MTATIRHRHSDDPSPVFGWPILSGRSVRS